MYTRAMLPRRPFFTRIWVLWTATPTLQRVSGGGLVAQTPTALRYADIVPPNEGRPRFEIQPWSCVNEELPSLPF